MARKDLPQIKAELEDLKIKNQAEARLKKAEVPLAKKPNKEKYEAFPDDITDIPDQDLGRFLGVYEAECAWVRYLIARREIDQEYGNMLLGHVYAKLFISSAGGATEKKAEVLADDFYLKCQKEIIEVAADLKLLYASLEACERYAKSISREMTMRRDQNWTNRSTLPGRSEEEKARHGDGQKGGFP